MNIKSNPHFNWNQFSALLTARRAIRGSTTIILGTGLAFILRLLFSLLKLNEELLRAYAKGSLPIHAMAMGIVIGIACLLILVSIAEKLWRSLRLGLLSFSMPIWVACIAIFWLSIESHYFRLAITMIFGPVIVALLINLFRNRPVKDQRQALEGTEVDLPLPENGQDLLGRMDIVNAVVAKILLEHTPIIAITAPYGNGKTSFLNLVLGGLRRLNDRDRPIIVKFSPWLAADPNNLILSLLNSIVIEMKKNYFVPGLKRDAFEYARTLLTAIPKFDRLKTFFSEPSQEEQIARLAQRISATDRRVLVVLDDLDRLQSIELETVFKVLGGSDAFFNLTFVCCFDRAELVRILKVTRPHQDINTFIEKFFQSVIPLPEIDAIQLKELFLQKMITVVSRNDLSTSDSQQEIEEVWNKGAVAYFQNLRRIKLFINRIDQSLARIGTEVNVQDFARLELVRDIAPTVYETIYKNPEYFYDGDLAFEVRFSSRFDLDEAKAKKQRADFYTTMIEGLPPDIRYVSQVLEELFPFFADYKGKFGRRREEAPIVEKDKRIFHPRCFRQYFLLKVPSELFSQKEFNNFLASIRNATEEGVKKRFNETFRAIEKEDFKRWHFVHRIDSVFEDFTLTTDRGLCRGMAEVSRVWSSDAFEFLAAARCTRSTLSKIKDSAEKQKFLLLLIKEYTSTLCALLLIEFLEKEALGQMPSDLQPIHDRLKDKIREHYLVPDAPSVFEEFHTDLGRIEPIQLFLAWRRLGTDAALDQEKYLLDLLNRRPTDLNQFLKFMFRIDFMDDYAALRPIIDYDRLAKLIDVNVEVLDVTKVQQFRKRYAAEKAGTVTPS
jgi:KAP family P-loop domain